MQASKPKVLVTGSSGLIGTAVIRRLAPDYELIGFDLQQARGNPGADFIEVDISQDESVLAGLQELRSRHGDRLASVVHLAAYYDFSGEPSSQYENITVRGTERLLQGLQGGFQVEQFLFSSTMLVHAPAEPGQKIDEHWPLAPKWDYPESKVRTEELLRAQHGDIPIVLARIAGIYDNQCHSIPLANQIQRIRERWLTSQVYPGDLSRGQAFLHLGDLVEAIARLIGRRRELPAETTVLLGEPETLSYGELQQQFGRLIHNQEWETRHVSKAVAKTGAWLQDHLPFVEDPFIKPFMVDLADDHYELDIRHARALLDWEPRHSLLATLPAMIAAMKSDPLGWYEANKLKPPGELVEH